MLSPGFYSVNRVLYDRDLFLEINQKQAQLSKVKLSTDFVLAFFQIRKDKNSYLSQDLVSVSYTISEFEIDSYSK